MTSQRQIQIDQVNVTPVQIAPVDNPETTTTSSRVLMTFTEAKTQERTQAKSSSTSSEHYTCAVEMQKETMPTTLAGVKRARDDDHQ